MIDGDPDASLQIVRVAHGTGGTRGDAGARGNVAIAYPATSSSKLEVKTRFPMGQHDEQ